MTDLLKGLSGGWAFLVSWVFPSALAWSVLAFLALPTLAHISIVEDLARTGAANQSLVLLGLIFLTGILLSSLSTVLYRLLEGYMFLPKKMRQAMTRRQQERQATLLGEVKALRAKRNAVGSSVSGSNDGELSPSQLAGIDVRIGLLNERVRKYPADARQFGPTAFANALRAIETYGWDRYRLDSQTLWSEIQSVIPEHLVDEHERSRAPVNFFVSLVYLSLLTGIALIATGVYAPGTSMTLVSIGVALVATAPLWYRLAIVNTRYLLATMQAAVNVSRVKLAESMGLVLPRALSDERDMWTRVYYFVHDPFDPDYDQDLNSYRVAPESTTPVKEEGFLRQLFCRRASDS